MNEGADGSRWIFEEQETQIENDRLAIARLNTKIERLSAKMLVLYKDEQVFYVDSRCALQLFFLKKLNTSEKVVV